LLRTAKYYITKGVYPKDALHLACAELAQCDYFITTDDKLIKKTGNEKNLRVVNPVTFIEINNF
jgi:predicted nucleic acid-binding protein